MTDLVIRRYAAILRREWWVILQAAVVVGVVAGLLAGRGQSSTDRASAQLYVESAVGPDGTLPLLAQPGNSGAAISGVLAASFARQASSQPVLEGAVQALGGESHGGLGGSVATAVDSSSRTITITASAGSGDEAVKLANAVAQSLVDVRWGLRKAALEAQITSTGNQLRDIQGQISQINVNEAFAKATNADTSSFETARAVWLAEYQTVFATQQQLQSSLLSKDNGVQLLLPAQRSTRSGSAHPLSRGLEGAAIGLVLGIGLAALRESMDTKVRDRERAEELSGLDTVAELPKVRGLAKRPLALVDQPRTQYAEAMRALRASLMWRDGQAAPATIAVTSAQSGDGNTTVAANLAAAFALAGVNTILVSADLRNPAPPIGLLDDETASRPGLGELLGGELEPLDPSDSAVVERVLVPTRVAHLRWLAGGSPDVAALSSSFELLSSARARKLFVMLAGLAEVVVIDAPPALLSDAATITGLVEGVLLVVGLGSTRRSTLTRTVRAWKAAPVTPLGLVLNRTRPAPNPAYGRHRGGSRPAQAKPPATKPEPRWRLSQLPKPSRGRKRHKELATTPDSKSTEVGSTPTEVGSTSTGAGEPFDAVSVTEREREILAAIAAGLSVKQTARLLEISTRTVESTKWVLCRKLGVRNPSQALARALEVGLLDSQPGESSTARGSTSTGQSAPWPAPRFAAFVRPDDTEGGVD